MLVDRDGPVGPDTVEVRFDDERAASDAGNAGRKVMTLIYAMALGADSIDDCDVLRAGQPTGFWAGALDVGDVPARVHVRTRAPTRPGASRDIEARRAGGCRSGLGASRRKSSGEALDFEYGEFLGYGVVARYFDETATTALPTVCEQADTLAGLVLETLKVLDENAPASDDECEPLRVLCRLFGLSLGLLA